MIQIDKNEIYESHGYRFKNFVTLTLEEKLMILEWRNHEKVRSVMVNKEIIQKDDHLRFIDILKDRNDCFYWLVLDFDNNPLGVLDIIHVDAVKDVGEIGFYLNPNKTGSGLRFVVECEFFIYNTIQLGNNMSTVDINNRDVLMLNTFLGRTYEGVKRIGDRLFYYNNHSTGQFIIDNYEQFTLKNYVAFAKAHKNIVNELKGKYYVN